MKTIPIDTSNFDHIIRNEVQCIKGVLSNKRRNCSYMSELLSALEPHLLKLEELSIELNKLKDALETLSHNK